MSESHTTQALLMGLAGEIFARAARLAPETLDPAPVVRVPGAKLYVAHVLNVRDKVIPLAELRARFGLAPAVFTPTAASWSSRSTLTAILRASPSSPTK